MAELEGPSAKRQKTNETDSFLKDFRNDKYKMEKLKHAYDAIEKGYEKMNLCLLEIIDANARVSEPFSRAACHTSKYENDQKRKISFRMGNIFAYGLAILKEFLGEKNPRIPEDEALQTALMNLLNFFYLDHSALFECRDTTEGQWAVKLAQHLLSPLSVSRSYTIDYHPCIDLEKEICPCKEQDRLVGKKGETAFGCSNGWHGKSDILVNDVPVDLAVHNEFLDENCSSVSSTEVKTGEQFYDNDLAKLLSQTIVFSFLQRKLDEKKMEMNNFLVPGIGISTESVIGFFYDSEEDVLLGTVPMDLHADQELCSVTVVFLWLTLNYKILCSGITKKMKTLKAHFVDRAGDRIEMYRNEVCMPLPKKHGEKNECKNDDYKWAIEQGIEDETGKNVGFRFKKLD